MDIEQLWKPPATIRWDDLPIKAKRILMFAEHGAVYKINEAAPEGFDYENVLSYRRLVMAAMEKVKDLPLKPKNTGPAQTTVFGPRHRLRRKPQKPEYVSLFDHTAD